jgi:hypothetical protein
MVSCYPTPASGPAREDSDRGRASLQGSEQGGRVSPQQTAEVSDQLSAKRKKFPSKEKRVNSFETSLI